MEENIDASKFYVPDQLSIVASHEIPLIQETSPQEVARLDEVNSKVIMPSQSFDIDSLFHIRQTSLRQAHQTYWHLIVTTTVCAIAIFCVLYFSFRSHVHNFIPCGSSANKSPEPSTLEQVPSPLPPEPKRRAYSPQPGNSKKEVVFTVYPTQPTD